MNKFDYIEPGLDISITYTIKPNKKITQEHVDNLVAPYEHLLKDFNTDRYFTTSVRTVVDNNEKYIVLAEFNFNKIEPFDPDDNKLSIEELIYNTIDAIKDAEPNYKPYPHTSVNDLKKWENRYVESWYIDKKNERLCGYITLDNKIMSFPFGIIEDIQIINNANDENSVEKSNEIQDNKQLRDENSVKKISFVYNLLQKEKIPKFNKLFGPLKHYHDDFLKKSVEVFKTNEYHLVLNNNEILVVANLEHKEKHGLKHISDQEIIDKIKNELKKISDYRPSPISRNKWYESFVQPWYVDKETEKIKGYITTESGKVMELSIGKIIKIN